MSFSLLGLITENVIISDKYCVEKTFPSFFRQIEKTFDLKHNFRAAKMAINKKSELNFEYCNKIVVIGMRAAGKTTLSKYAAEKLNSNFFDIDAQMEKVLNLSLNKFIRKNGWAKFRKMEIETFSAILEKKGNTIISCGGGIVETALFSKMVKNCCVVFVVRDIEKIKETLFQKEKNKRISLPNCDFLDVYFNRKVLYKKLSKYEFYVTEDLAKDKKNFALFCKKIFQPKINLKEYLSRQSFMACLTLPEYSNLDQVAKMTTGHNAVEMRVDMLKNFSDIFIAKQLYNIWNATELPVIFTLLPKSKGGYFPDNKNLYASFIRFGIRLGCSIVSVECDDEKTKQKILSHKNCKVLLMGCYHSPKAISDIRISKQKLKLLMEMVSNDTDISKIVVANKTSENALSFMKTTMKLKKRFGDRMFIILDRGQFGTISRIFNKEMSPCACEGQKRRAAKGQFTMKQLLNLRNGVPNKEMKKKEKVLLFGSDISSSLSPLIHNFVYSCLSIPFSYFVCEKTSFSDVKKKMQEKNYFAANVTMPFKEKMFGYLENNSKDASTIKAVNSVHRDAETGKLIGNNTDWKGLLTNLEKMALETGERFEHNAKAVVIGAGGTSRAAIFALKKFGIEAKSIFVFNRTLEKSLLVSKEFECSFVTSLEDIYFKNQVVILVVTVPNNARLQIPSALKENENLIIIDFNYSNDLTFVEKQILKPLYSIRGINILVEQAKAAIEIWFDRKVDIDTDVIVNKISKN